jgi:hypothetical protein
VTAIAPIVAPIVARILIRAIVARLWTRLDTARKSKGPERLEPRRACNWINSPDDRKDGGNCNPLLPDPISACKGEVCSFQAVQGCATSGGP